MVVCSFVSFCVDMPRVRGDLNGHQLDGDEKVDAPLSCYNVKWRNRKVAITGLVQLSNLISSDNRNKT